MVPLQPFLNVGKVVKTLSHLMHLFPAEAEQEDAPSSRLSSRYCKQGLFLSLSSAVVFTLLCFWG